MSEESEREEIKDETHHILDEEQEELDEAEEEEVEWEVCFEVELRITKVCLYLEISFREDVSPGKSAPEKYANPWNLAPEKLLSKRTMNQRNIQV
jgi:hypothetical protein